MTRYRTARLDVLGAALLLAAPVAAQTEMTWRQLDPANTVHMEIGEGSVVIELNPLFAPTTVAQFKRLVREDFYRGLSFYRVIDGFVAQGGDESDIDVPNSQPKLEAEFEIEWSDELEWVTVQRDDLYADETGFIDGFAAATDRSSAWLTHCPGVVAMARNNEPDTGSTDFYIVIGQAPRYLDRNLTIFGRVVAGMDAAQRIRRGPVERNGVIDGETDRSRIRKMTLGSDLPDNEKVEVFVMDTASAGFAEYLEARRNRTDAFFHHKPPRVLDVCQVPIGVRMEKSSSLPQAGAGPGSPL
jgi:peptidylprolyl isomerase